MTIQNTPEQAVLCNKCRHKWRNTLIYKSSKIDDIQTLTDGDYCHLITSIQGHYDRTDFGHKYEQYQINHKSDVASTKDLHAKPVTFRVIFIDGSTRSHH